MNLRSAALLLLPLPALAQAQAFGTSAEVRLDYLSAADGTDRRSDVQGLGFFASARLDVEVPSTGSQVRRAGGDAYASLERGKLGANSYAGFSDPYRYTARYGYTANASATMWDTVTIKAGSGLNLGVIPLQLALDGSVSGNEYPRRLSNADVFLQVLDLDFDGKEIVNVRRQGIEGDVFLDTGLDAGDDLVPLVDRHYRIQFGLTTHSTIGGRQAGAGSTSADFLNTLRFNWALPAGATFTSESGVFQPGQIQAVPEPAPLAALGLGGLAFLRRRKRA